MSNPTDVLSTMGMFMNTKQKSWYCSICKSSAFATSKHCGICHRCVYGFDHHCKWINNCIGKSNYKAFFWSILFLAMNSIIVFGFDLIFLIDFFTDNSFLHLNIGNKAGLGQNLYGWVVEMLMLAIYALFAFAFSFYLVLLHIKLRKEGISTYECLIRKKGPRVIRFNQSNELELSTIQNPSTTIS